MRALTAWTMPGMPLRERVHRTSEAAVRGLARRLPRRLAYWSFIHVGTRAMRPDDVVPEVRYVDLLQRAEGAPS